MLVRIGFGIALLLVGLLVLRAAARRARKSWVLLSASESNVASLMPGKTAAVSGTAMARSDERVDAPLLDEAGLLTGTSIQRYESGSDGSGNWNTFYDSIDSASFAIQDDTGRVAIDPPTASDYSGDVDFSGGINIDRRLGLIALPSPT